MRRSIKLWVKDSQRSQPLKRVLKAIFHLRPPTPPPKKNKKRLCQKMGHADCRALEYLYTTCKIVYTGIPGVRAVSQFLGCFLLGASQKLAVLIVEIKVCS